VKLLTPDSRHNYGPNLAVTLKQSHHSDFAHTASAFNLSRFVAPVHVASKTTDERLIDFNVSSQLLGERSGLHGKSDSVKHEPSSLLCYPNSAVNLIGTNAILTVSDHPDRH